MPKRRIVRRTTRKKPRTVKRTGWGVRGRPFSKTEYNKSYLKSGSRMSYGKYLSSYARAYKNKKL